jgi:hypothetical protein
MGALTINTRERGVMGNLKWAAVDAQFSTSYATGGDTGLTRAALGFDMILLVIPDQPAGFEVHYNYTTGTLLARRTDLHDHVLHFQTVVAANAVTAAANQLRTAAAAFDVNGVVNNVGEGGVVRAAQGAFAEPAATTNLSTTVVSAGLVDENGVARNAVRCLVFGR